MTFISKTHLADGSIRIKIARSVTLLRNDNEARAFMAGYKIAQVEIAKRIAHLLKVTDRPHEL